MPGLGLGLCVRQELRLEQRLELGDLLLLRTEEEKGIQEQREQLLKMHVDIEKGVYTEVAEFHYRVMKRIKKEKRTQPVKDLVARLRETIDHHQEELDLQMVDGIIVYGIWSADYRERVDEAIQTFDQVAQRSHYGIEEMLSSGLVLYNRSASAHGYFTSILGMTEDDKLLTEIFTNTMNRMVDNEKYIPLISSIVGNALHKTPYNDTQIALFLDLVPQLCDLDAPTTKYAHEFPVSSFLRTKKLTKLVGNHANLPLPLLHELYYLNVTDEVLSAFERLATTKHMRKSKDNMRAVVGSLALLQKEENAGKVVADIVSKANGAKQVRNILNRASSLSLMGGLQYDFDLEDGDQIYAKLKRLERTGHPLLAHLDNAALDVFHDEIIETGRSPYLKVFEPLLVYSRIMAEHKQEVLPALGALMTSLIQDNYKEWRGFQGDEARMQLNSIEKAKRVWVEDHEEWRRLGDIEGVRPQYEAIMESARYLRDRFPTVYGAEISFELIKTLHEKKQELKKRVAVDSSVHDELKKVDGQLIYARVIDQLLEVELDDFPMIAQIISGQSREYLDDEFFQMLNNDIWTQTVSPEALALNRVIVQDTDDPLAMLKVGVDPQKSCQRYIERTSYNHCLTAYLCDPNKRLFQVLSTIRKPELRSIVRLIVPEESDAEAMLFIERPYGRQLSSDLIDVLTRSVLKKAVAVSEATGKLLAVGTAHDIYSSALSRIATELKLNYYKGRLSTTFAPSRGTHEYSDAFGGSIKSGSTVSCQAKWVQFKAD